MFCGAPWEAIAAEHADALERSGAPWEMTVGLVGPDGERSRARAWWAGRWPGTTFIQSAGGYEQVTLRGLRRWSESAPGDAAVLYAHAKGITHKNGGGVHGMAWRRSMTAMLVTNWRECERLLAGKDAVGCHWLDPAHPALPPGRFTHPFFGGNFWWSKASYLACLPEPGTRTRYDAEAWIGLGNPDVADLRPGFPDVGHYRLEMMEILNPGLAGMLR